MASAGHVTIEMQSRAGHRHSKDPAGIVALSIVLASVHQPYKGPKLCKTKPPLTQPLLPPPLLALSVAQP